MGKNRVLEHPLHFPRLQPRPQRKGGKCRETFSQTVSCHNGLELSLLSSLEPCEGRGVLRMLAKKSCDKGGRIEAHLHLKCRQYGDRAPRAHSRRNLPNPRQRSELRWSK